MQLYFITTLFFIQLLFSQPRATADLYFVEDSQSNKLALKIDLEKGWHIYWLNSGDSGIPTEIKWELPNGFSIFKIHWPVPKAFETDGLVSYGYENNTVLLFDISSPNSDDKFDQVLSIKLNSLICKEVCIPFDTVLSFKISELKKVDDLSKLISTCNIKFPESTNDLSLRAIMKDDKVILEMSATDIKTMIQEISFFPFEGGVFKNIMKNSFVFNSDKYLIDLYFDPFKTHSPEKLKGLLVIRFEENEVNKSLAYDISVEINN